FYSCELARSIQDRALMRNVDSKIHATRFDCFKFLFHSFAAATFATQSAITGREQAQHRGAYSITASVGEQRQPEPQRLASEGFTERNVMAYVPQLPASPCHYGLMPANFTTLAHFSVSSAINAPNSVGVIGIGSAPRPLIRALT